MSMTKAMCVEPHCFEKSENRLVTKRNTVRADTDQGLPDTTIWRWDFFREYEQDTISVCVLVYDLICLTKLHLILCLFTLECVKIGQEGRISIECSDARLGFGCVEEIFNATLTDNRDFSSI